MAFFDESLIDDIRAITRQRQRPRTTADVRQEGSAISLMSRFNVENGRIARVAHARKMYDGDTRYEQVINTFARDVAGAGFSIEMDHPNDHAMEIATQLQTRLELLDRLDDWCRLTFRDGDSFLEVGVDADRLIQVVTRKPTLNMFRNSDNFDTFPNPEHAYWYSDRPFITSPPRDALWFAEWQIIHARWSHDEGSRYGRPMMNSGRKAYKRLDEGETDMAVRRKVRAGMRIHHVVEGDESAIAKYKKQNKAALNNPTAALLDYFSNKPGGISTIQGDNNIGKIEDVIHHLETWWVASPVPRGLLGYGRDLNRSILADQKEQYDETIEAPKKWMLNQFVRPLLELQWLLMGILPETLGYKLVPGKKEKVSADDILKAAQAAQILRLLNISEKVIAMILSRFLPGIDMDMLLADVPSPNDMNSDDAERLAAMAAQLMNGLSGTKD
ncbi:MAG: hypothetical protein GY943_16785 [Chloroflexi bacterium]|nr:hypothetical protein [Chloroflexota bacterium]